MDKKSSNCGKYFWACAGVYQGTGEKGEGCGFWQLGVFDENGEPEWWNESGNNKRSVEVEVEVV